MIIEIAKAGHTRELSTANHALSGGSDKSSDVTTLTCVSIRWLGPQSELGHSLSHLQPIRPSPHLDSMLHVLRQSPYHG